MTPGTDPAVRAIAETCHVSLEVAEQAWRAAQEAARPARAAAEPCANCGHPPARHVGDPHGACLDCACTTFVALYASEEAPAPEAYGGESDAAARQLEEADRANDRLGEITRTVTAGDGGTGAEHPH